MHLDDEQIWEYIFLDEKENETIKNHLAACELCRTRAEAVEEEEFSLKKMIYPVVSANFTEDTVARILAKAPTRIDVWNRIFRSLFIFSIALCTYLILMQLIEKKINLNVQTLATNFWVLNLLPVSFLVLWVYFAEQRKIISHL